MFSNIFLMPKLEQYEKFTVAYTTQILGTSYDLYSYTAPSVLSGEAFSGGWLSAADIGPDVIWVSPKDNLNLAAPITWTNPETAAQYHNNDPSVIEIGNVMYMYMTSLSNQYTSLNDITNNNTVALAKSFDGGKTWDYLGPQFSGWSPSAIQLHNDIYIFFHNAQSQTEFEILANNGTTTLSAPQLTNINAINVSVIQVGKELILVGNDGNFGEGFGNIVAYTASVFNPTHWIPLLASGDIIAHGKYMNLTPEIISEGKGNFTLTYTEDLAHDSYGFPIIGAAQETVTMKMEFHLG